MEITNRNLYRVTRFILLKLPYVFRLLAYLRPVKKRLLIIKADAIGDYIMFRNFVGELKSSDKYRDHEIHWLGNAIWADLALEIDSTVVEKFIFTKPNSLYSSPRQVFKIGWQLFAAGYSHVLNPNTTRTFITDGFAGLTAAKSITGFETDTEGIPLKFKLKTDRFYTRLLKLPADVYFEFYRNKYFFEEVLGHPVQLTQPNLMLETGAREGIMIIPGAGHSSRAWEAAKFIDLLKLILTQTGQTVYIAGAQSDVNINQYIAAQFNTPQLVNITGQTSLPALCRRIAGATMVIANDSGAIHIAAATATPSVCIVGGGHFERFVPYPHSFTNQPFCVFKKMDCYYCNWQCIYPVSAGQVFPCIGNVTVSDVWQAVQQINAQ